MRVLEGIKKAIWVRLMKWLYVISRHKYSFYSYRILRNQDYNKGRIANTALKQLIHEDITITGFTYTDYTDNTTTDIRDIKAKNLINGAETRSLAEATKLSAFSLSL